MTLIVYLGGPADGEEERIETVPRIGDLRSIIRRRSITKNDNATYLPSLTYHEYEVRTCESCGRTKHSKGRIVYTYVGEQ